MNSFYRFALTRADMNGENVTKIRIEGLMTTEAFQRARLCALKLHGHLPHRFAVPEIREMLQIEWHENLENLRRCVGGKIWKLKRPVVVFIDNELIGSDVEFIRHMSKSYAFNLPVQSTYYENLIAERYKRFIENSGRKFVYFTFTIDDKVIGSFLFMVRQNKKDLLPHTCEHFLKFCTGYRSEMVYGIELSYKNTRVHRIVKNGWIQLGDILESCKDFEESLIDEMTIYDETFCVPHDRRGVLSMANDGRHRNRDQFVVSLKPNNWMNCHYVAFGQLMDGAKTLQTIENIPTCYEAPLKKISISECGEYSFKQEAVPKATQEEEWGIKEGGENEENPDTTNLNKSCPNISAWSYNIPDRIDERDTASLLMVERYNKGLYSLSTDNLPDHLQVSEGD